MAEGDDLLHHKVGRRETITRQAVGRLHDKSVGLSPFRRLGRAAGSQLEIASVKQGAGIGFEEELGRAENMAGGQERDTQAADRRQLTKWQDVFVAFAGKARLHQTRSSFRNDDLVVRSDVVAVCMGNESERSCVRRIEPNVFVW